MNLQLDAMQDLQMPWPADQKGNESGHSEEHTYKDKIEHALLLSEHTGRQLVPSSLRLHVLVKGSSILACSERRGMAQYIQRTSIAGTAVAHKYNA